jgi:hypothetical protein
MRKETRRDPVRLFLFRKVVSTTYTNAVNVFGTLFPPVRTICCIVRTFHSHACHGSQPLQDGLFGVWQCWVDACAS